MRRGDVPGVFPARREVDTAPPLPRRTSVPIPSYSRRSRSSSSTHEPGRLGHGHSLPGSWPRRPGPFQLQAPRNRSSSRRGRPGSPAYEDEGTSEIGPRFSGRDPLHAVVVAGLPGELQVEPAERSAEQERDDFHRLLRVPSPSVCTDPGSLDGSGRRRRAGRAPWTGAQAFRQACAATRSRRRRPDRGSRPS